MPRNPLFLRILLKALRPSTVQANFYKWTVLVTIPFYSYLYWGRAYFTNWHILLGATTLLAVLAVPAIVACNALIERVTRRFPEPQQVLKRAGTLLLLLTLLFCPGTVLNFWFMDAVHLFGYRYNPATAPWIVLSVFLVNVLVVGVFELVLAFHQWQTNELGAEQLAHQQLHAQLDEVKQQISPHFLFNSLNSLSVLIGEDPRQAERFVDELAQVYRYLLHAHRRPQADDRPPLVSLDAELRYLRSYAYLLRTRYGPGLDLRIDTPPDDVPRPGQLLPLTLQTLVDNAIRHNVVSASRPLHIAVDATAGGVVRVRNSRQHRPVRVPVPQESLADLQARYQRLPGAPALHVAADDDSFTVAVRLLSPDLP